MRILALLLLLLPLAGCQNPLQAPAENLTETVFPDHRGYVATQLTPDQVQEIVAEPERAPEIVAEPGLSEIQVDVRLDLLDAFERTVNMGRDGQGYVIPPPVPRE